jgi:DNA-binding LytR/AlgR family response regulator
MQIYDQNNRISSQKLLFFNSRDELLRIDLSKIVYFEAEGNYTNIITANKLKSCVCMNLSLMEKTLAETLKEESHQFARVGKKYIINLNYVFNLNVLRRKLIMSDETDFVYDLDISREAIKNLKELLIKIKI